MGVSAADGMSRVVGTCQASRLGRSRSIEVRSVRLNRKRKAGDHGDDSRELPASQDDSTDSRAEHIVTTTEGKLVGEALLKVQCAIEVQRGVVSAPVDVEQEAAIVVACDVAHRLAPGERGSKGKTVGKALVE